jgi:predicted PurR-regulated permease PerM
MANMDKPNRSLVENVILLLLFLALLYASYTTISAFLGIFTFALIFSVAFAGLFNKLAGWLGSRKIAAFVYGILLVAVVAVPFVYIISELAGYAGKAQSLVAQIKDNNVPPLPEWLGTIPLVGEKISTFWADLQADPQGVLALHEAHIKDILQRILATGGGILGTGLELIVGIIISSIFLFHGESTLSPIRNFARHLISSSKGEMLIQASGRAINGVAVGVLGTAFIEAAVAYIGFRIAGLEMASGLTAIMFLFALIQLGPVLVMIPIIVWLANSGSNAWAIFMGVWLVVLIVVDNVVKPILIGKSGKLPILVLFFGVLGGMSAWGFTGMFKGAVMLALVYTLFTTWDENTEPDAPVVAGEK